MKTKALLTIKTSADDLQWMFRQLRENRTVVGQYIKRKREWYYESKGLLYEFWRRFRWCAGEIET